jgi:hypothetical protein
MISALSLIGAPITKTGFPLALLFKTEGKDNSSARALWKYLRSLTFPRLSDNYHTLKNIFLI